MIFRRFPYTTLNDINLDWIIKRVKTLSDAVASIDISRMDEIAEQAETAQQDAETALTTAQSAETTAQSAETTANSVQGIANNALTTAQSAETTAQNAETTANSVQGIANNALTTAQSAETTANSVQGIANNALTTAQSAETTAQSAQTAVTALNDSKADKVRGATLGNFASLAASGNLLDSGFDSGDFAAAAAGVPAGGTAGQVLTNAGSTDYETAWQTPSGGGGDVTADMIGIVINGNSTTVGASEGQYVIVKDSTISGRSDGLYKAAKLIPANTAIDSNYLRAVTDGGLNELKSSYEKWMFPKGTTVNASLPTNGAQYTAPSDGNLEIRFYNGYLIADGPKSAMTPIANWSGATAAENSTVVISHMKKGATATVWRTATISNSYFTPCG